MNKLTGICAALLLIGCFPLPIGYYMFLRIAVCIASIVLIVHEHEKGLNFSNILWGMIAILFNPIIPVYLHDKDIWVILDIIAAVLFAVKTYRLTKEKKHEN